jgi:ligand-binding SRPBCC domain-containing protein
MTTIELTTVINAPIELCFDLSRSIDLHTRSTGNTKERAIAGRTSGLIEKGETVTWEAVHFGVKQQLSTRIPEMKAPHYFSDEMVKGAFKSLYHQHYFESNDGSTVMTDVFKYETPYGIFGKLLDILVLKSYMTRFLKQRNATIKSEAEQAA